MRIVQTAALLPMVFANAISFASAQQVHEILVDSGRTIVGGIEYDFGDVQTIDHARGLIYLVESRDPYMVEARSLDDGSVVSTYGRGLGNGPGEVEVIWDIAATPEGVLVADGTGIAFWYSSGDLGFDWNPEAPFARTVCAFSGRPAVPLHPSGVAVRKSDGSADPVGIDKASRSLRFPKMTTVPSQGEAIQLAMGFAYTKLACSDSVAYVLGEDDVLTGYTKDGAAKSVPVPATVVRQARRRREGNRPGVFRQGYSRFDLDNTGRLFISQWDQPFAGTVIDPGTGGYTLLRDNARHRRSRWYVGMHRDSVISVRVDPSPETMNGRQVTVIHTEPSHISIYPVRPVSDPSGRGGNEM